MSRPVHSRPLPMLLTAAILLAAPPALAQTTQGLTAEPEAQPYRVVSVLGLLGRVVVDEAGSPVAVVRDVVMAREGSGPVLALLEARPGGETVAVPVHSLRFAADGGLHLGPDAPSLAELPAIGHTPGPAAGPAMAASGGLIVPTSPDPGGLPQVQPPQTASQPAADASPPQ